MNSRERIRMTLNHQEPDYVPIDLGGCGQTGMNASTLNRLRKAYGLPEHPIKIVEPFQMLGAIEDDLIEKINSDVIPLWNPTNLMGTSNTKTKPWNMYDGTPVLMSDNFEYEVDQKGGTYVYPCGDRTANYSLHMPKGGTFFDNINRSEKVDEDNLTPIEDFKDSYTLHTQETCKYWEAQSKRLYEETEYSIFGVLGGMGLGDAAEIPGPYLKNPKGIRSMEDWLMAHYLYPGYIQAVFEYQTEIALKNLELYRQSVQDRIDVIWLSGTDFGTQNGLFLSPDLFRQMYKPFYKKVNDWIHKNTNWKIFYHSCGAIFELLPDFIEMGVDIINPVQCSALGMDPIKLKDNFGDKITFWGGGINTQNTLPYGSRDEIKEEVKERLKVFSEGGGFVFAAVHNVVANVSPESLISMYEAVTDFRNGQTR